MIIAVLPFPDTLLESLPVVVEVTAQVPQFFILRRKQIAIASAMHIHVLLVGGLLCPIADAHHCSKLAHAHCTAHQMLSINARIYQPT